MTDQYDPDVARAQLEPWIVRDEGEETRAFCPLCEDPGASNSPSASFNFNADRWNCLKTDGHGGTVGKLVRDLELEVPRGRIIHRNVSRPSDAQPLPSAEDVELWHKKLLDDVELVADLEDTRGWSVATLKRFQIGWNERDFRFTIPIHDAEGRLVNVKRYRPGVIPPEPKMKGVFGHNKAAIFGYDTLRQNNTILWCAGEPDRILAVQEGFPAVTQTGGEIKRFLPEWGPLFEGKTVYVCYDADDAGRAGADRTIEVLSQHALAVYRVNLPEVSRGYDITDLLMEEGPAALQSYLDTAELETAEPHTDHDPRRLEDAHIAETISNQVLRGVYCWSPGLDWMHYDVGRWKDTTPEHVGEVVRQEAMRMVAEEVQQGVDPARFRALGSLLNAGRIRAIVSLAKGILAVEPERFDRHHELLNVANGVIHLPTGELIPHSPDLFLTKITKVPYVPGAVAEEWDIALAALPAEVADWMQVRIGQAASGHPTSDDIMPVLWGGGSNGKTTILGAIQMALGDHAVTVPERVLMANPSDHPTELMTLRGARMAIIEETPEARHLNVKRLKDTVGTPAMTARLIRQNNVTWECTHSLIITTNYRPRVDETDHGTWRRLALVQFPYTYIDPESSSTNPMARSGVPGLRERLRDGLQGQHEAVLSWIVAGSKRWYDESRIIPVAPKQVRDDTMSWRGEADLIISYVTENLVFDVDRHIASVDLFGEFTEWLKGRGHHVWTDNTFSSRFGNHSTVESAHVEKRQVSASDTISRPPDAVKKLPKRYMAWVGVRFRTAED
jgi:putative DNA primase/helicase